MHNYTDSGDGKTCFRKVDEYRENTTHLQSYNYNTHVFYDVQVAQCSGYDLQLVCNICSAHTIREKFTLITSYHAEMFEIVMYAIVMQ